MDLLPAFWDRWRRKWEGGAGFVRAVKHVFVESRALESKSLAFR